MGDFTYRLLKTIQREFSNFVGKGYLWISVDLGLCANLQIAYRKLSSATI